MPYILKVKHHFESAHRLENYEGKCARTHGHRWQVEVSIAADTLEKDMVVDFDLIKTIIDEYDHTYLNEIVDFNPTAENLARHFKKRIDEATGLSSEVTLWENPDSSITYR